MVGRNRSNIARKCWCFLWIFAVFCYKTTDASTTATPDDPCGTLAQISEKLWEADSGSRFTFGDVESVFPDLTNFSDAAISQAIEMTSEESLPDIIVFLGAAKRGQNSGNSTKLFQFVKRKVYDNYHFSDISDTFNPQPLRRDAPLSGDKFYNIQEFLNSISYSNVMGEFSTYLNCKGSDYASDIWDILSGLWFSGYSRYYAQCGEDSSGFEYTFVGEYTLEGSKVLGLHNWINLYWLERGNEMQYESFNGLYEPNLLALSFTWNGREQSQGSVFLGTSPEFELAIYTLCFLEKVGQDCTLSLGGHEITLRTFEFDHTVQAAYPVIPTYNYSPDPPPTPSYRINVDCNPTTPPPRTACDSLSEIAEKLWTGDSNRLSFSDSATSSSADIVLDFNTGTKLFKYVDDSKVNYPLYKALRNLTDNYDPQPYTDDYVIYPDEVSEVESFLDLLITTRPITELRDYLTCKEHLTDQKDIKSLLWDLWFMEIYRYTEAFGLDSSGFEYTFVGEFDPYDNDVVGLHDWYRLYVLERDGDLNYTGYIDLSQPNLLEVSYTWERHVKNHGYVLLGSSVEFQMAVYTLCYMEMPGSLCPLTMGGRVVTLMTVDRDGTVSEAYPVSTSPTTTTATSNSTTTTTTKTTSTTTTTTPTPTTTTTTTTTTPTTTTTTTTPTITSTTTTTTPTPTTTTITTTPTPITTTITATTTPTTTTTTSTPTPTTTTTTTTPTPTTTTTTTTPTPTTTYPTTTTIPTQTTTTPTPTPIRRTPTTVKTPTTPNSSSSTGGVLVLLMLQLVLHWFLK